MTFLFVFKLFMLVFFNMSCVHANLRGTFIKNDYGDFFLYFDKDEFVDCFGDLSIADIVVDTSAQMVLMCCYGEIIGAALDVYDFIDFYDNDLTVGERMLIDQLLPYSINKLKVLVGYN